MNSSQYGSPDPAPEEGEPQGAERYLQPGEELRICSSDIQIKKFRFEAYLTNRRLFLIDQNDPKPGVTAKEIPVGSVIGSYLEDSPSREPVIVLSVRTADDDIRTMKMTFAHTGEERATEAEEWIHLISQSSSRPGETPSLTKTPGPSPPSPVLSPEARALSDTMVFPSPRPAEPTVRPKEEKAPAQRSRPPAAAPPRQPPELSPSTITPIQYCFHCGKKLPAQANFCPYCGTKVHQSAQTEEFSHLRLPVHQHHESPEVPQDEPKKKGWKRLFGR
jgi:hypothetical protein